MARGLYRFRVDWDGDHNFVHAESDITLKAWQIRCRRGRDGRSTLTNRSVGGTLTATLYNPSGLFSSFNTASALYGLILPRRKVQLQMRVSVSDPWTNLWTGWLITIVPEYTPQSHPTAQLFAHGSLALLNSDKARVSNQLNILTGAAYDLVLDAANWPNYYNETVLADAPAGYWRLGESSGNAIDASGNGNDGTVTGATQGATGLLEGHSDTAYSFDGASGDVDMGSPAVLDDIFSGGGTFEAWINASSDGEANNGRLVDKSTWYAGVSSESGGAMKITFSHTFSTTAGVWETTGLIVTVGQAHHICITYNRDSVGNDPVLYVDGASVALTESVTPVGTASTDAAGNLIIGNEVSDARTFDGIIDEAAVYSTILTAAQARQHHIAGVQRWRDVDVGLTTMTRYWADSGALYAQRKIDDTDGGFTREGRDGATVFEDRFRRLEAPHTTSQQTYTDEAATIRYRDISQDDPFEDVYKTFRAYVTEHTVGSVAVLWTVVGEPSIEPGQTVDFWPEYPSQTSPVEAVGVSAWTTPVASTDYVANSQSGGGGSDLTGNMAVTVSKFFASMKVSITNNATVKAYLTTLQARGAPLDQLETASVTYDVPDSPVESEWPSPAEFIPTMDEANNYVRVKGLVHGQTIPLLTVGYSANAADAFLTDALSREVSDRVTVKSDAATFLGINEDFFIEAISHNIDRRGRHQVGLELSPARVTAPFWVLGKGALGSTTALMYRG